VGWAGTDREADAIDRAPEGLWQPAIDQSGNVLDDTFHRPDRPGRPGRPNGPGRLAAHDPRPADHRPRRAAAPQVPQAGHRPGETAGRRCQLIATSTQAGQVAWLDTRHRSHVHVENDVKQAKALGLNRWPSRHWKINVAWTQAVALASSLLACFRHLALPAGELRDAAPELLRYRLFHLPSRQTRGQRKRSLHLRAGRPWPGI